MDNVKIFTKKEKWLETLTQTKRMYRRYIRMGSGITQCAMLMMKSGERETLEVIKRPNKRSIKTVGEKENYKLWGIIEMDTIKQTVIKE